jgi:hypothetical protein
LPLSLILKIPGYLKFSFFGIIIPTLNILLKNSRDILYLLILLFIIAIVPFLSKQVINEDYMVIEVHIENKFGNAVFDKNIEQNKIIEEINNILTTNLFRRVEVLNTGINKPFYFPRSRDVLVPIINSKLNEFIMLLKNIFGIDISYSDVYYYGDGDSLVVSITIDNLDLKRT